MPIPSVDPITDIEGAADEAIILLPDGDTVLSAPLVMSGPEKVKIIGGVNSRFVWDAVGGDQMLKLENCRHVEVKDVAFHVNTGKSVTCGIELVQANDATVPPSYNLLHKLLFDAADANSFTHCIKINNQSLKAYADLTKIDRCAVAKFSENGIWIESAPYSTVGVTESAIQATGLGKYCIKAANLLRLEVEHNRVFNGTIANIHLNAVKTFLSVGTTYEMNSTHAVMITDPPSGNNNIMLGTYFHGPPAPSGTISLKGTPPVRITNLLVLHTNDTPSGGGTPTMDPLLGEWVDDYYDGPIIWGWPPMYLPPFPPPPRDPVVADPAGNVTYEPEFVLPRSRFGTGNPPTIGLSGQIDH